MSKKNNPPVFKDPSRATKNNPKGYDYNRDTVVDAYDDALAVQDNPKNPDGYITDKEKERYTQEQGTVTQTFKTDDKGNIVETQTVSPVTDLGTPQPWLDELTKEFLKQHPEVARALRLARENNWDQELFNRYIENNTAFGKSRTDAQAAFDLAIAGSQSEDVKKQISDKATEISALAKDLLGTNVALDPQKLNEFSRQAIRDGLSETSVRLWVAGQYQGNQPKTPTAEEVTQGKAFSLDDSLRSLARSYGLPVNDDFINNKVREGLGQQDIQSWLAGQRGVFRQQAKTLYPSVADLLDASDLETIMTPYQNTAYNLLGIPTDQQHLTDPMWNAALKGGTEGGPMSMDEWTSVLKSDKRYGWSKTANGRAQISSLTQRLLSAFGVG